MKKFADNNRQVRGNKFGRRSSAQQCGKSNTKVLVLILLILSGISGVISHLGRDDDAAGPSLEQKAYSRDLALVQCQKAIQENAVNPSTVNIHFWGLQVGVSADGSRIVNQRFSAKNKFNMEQTFMAQCAFTQTGEMAIDVNEINAR